ncbi:hypothetical protein BD560DRAFT_429347 [Blakeslea trispora]|nr:hypothetical protein BD560DRAFT_429347 [Blakeslea trispora]
MVRSEYSFTKRKYIGYSNIKQQASLVYRYVGLKVSGAYLAWLEDLYKGTRTSITVVLFVATTCSLSLLFPQYVYLFTFEVKEQRILVQMIGAKRRFRPYICAKLVFFFYCAHYNQLKLPAVASTFFFYVDETAQAPEKNKHEKFNQKQRLKICFMAAYELKKTQE